MAALPSPDKVAGPYVPQFEIYWKKLDPNDTGKVSPMDAASFLKLSGLSDQTLGKVWDLSDPEGVGYLDKTGLFVACKLVALSQANREILLESVLDTSPAPNFGQATAPGAVVAEAPRGTPAPSINFLVKPEEKRKYDALFDQLKPAGGFLPGDKVRNVMLGSKMPMSMLGKIWDLADQDKDGQLDRYEFTVAMHLVYRALQGDMIPDQLPAELSQSKVPAPLSAPIVLPELNMNGSVPRPTSTTLDLGRTLQPSPAPITLGSSSQPLVPNPSTLVHSDQTLAPNTPTLDPNHGAAPGSPSGPSRVQAIPWVVNAGDRLRYEALFKQTDNDKDGFVSGVEIKNIFLQTGLPQNILAHIWNLCDMKQEGKLNPEQFALAMYLVQQKQAGKDPPAALTPDMVPPTMRPKPAGGDGADQGNRSVYNNPELEAMAREIQELLQEKMTLEREVQEQEYNISARNTETHSLQTEFDTLNATLTQLTNQKNIAQKRLDDLDGQKTSLGTDLQQLESRISVEQEKITKLRGQADEQEATLKEQEDEVNGKKRELEVLVDEESKLGDNIKKSQKEIEMLMKGLADVESLLTETTQKLTEFDELEKHMTEANTRFELVMSSSDMTEAENVPDTFLAPVTVSFNLPDYSRLDRPSHAGPSRPERPPEAPSTTISPMHMNGRMSSSDNDPFSNQSMSPAEPTSLFNNAEPTSLFNNDDAFANFGKPEAAAIDPFNAVGSSGFVSGNASAFTSTFPTPNSFTNDPFSAFGSGFGSAFEASQEISRGETPPALAPRPGENDSPTPALPPKNKGGPPKRPPPPRRPPPPKSAPAMSEPPGRPAPPDKSSLQTTPANDDPFGGVNAFSDSPANNMESSTGGFADFSAFESQEFSSSKFGLSADNKNDNSWGASSDPFSASEIPPSDTTTDSATNGTNGRYAGLEFFEDPFKNSNYRYGDPFDLENANTDPFTDPFNAPENKVFGADPFASDPFKSESMTSDPFAPAESSYENSAIPPDPFTKTDNDPFGGATTSVSNGNSSDPFGNSFTTNFNTGVPNVDPFGTNNNFGSSSNDPFSLTNLKPVTSTVPDINSNPTKSSAVTATTSTVSYRKEKVTSTDSTNSEKGLKKKPSHSLSDFLTGSPLKAEKGDKSKEKKDKKHGKFHISSPLKTHKSKTSESPKVEKKSSKNSSSEAATEEVQLKMAAEMSKRTDDDRRRKLQLQEEADLAYAIALSKAEAASLKT